MSDTASDLDPADRDTVEAGRARSRRRRLIVLLLILVVGGLLIAWQWDRFSYAVLPSRFGLGGGPSGPAGIPTYTQAQGAQDAPRAEVMTNRSHDYETCMETLRLRRVEQATAQDTCRKMVQGLYGGR